jgi:hypothetical protein
MTAHKERDCYTVEMILRNLPEQTPFVIQWQYPIMKLRPDLDPADIEQPKRPGSKAGAPGFKMPTTEQVLAHLPTLSQCHGEGKTLDDGLLPAVVLLQSKLSINKNHHAAVRETLIHEGTIKEVKLKKGKIAVGRPEVVDAYHELERKLNTPGTVVTVVE